MCILVDVLDMNMVLKCFLSACSAQHIFCRLHLALLLKHIFNIAHYNMMLKFAFFFITIEYLDQVYTSKKRLFHLVQAMYFVLLTHCLSLEPQ